MGPMTGAWALVAFRDESAPSQLDRVEPERRRARPCAARPPSRSAAPLARESSPRAGCSCKQGRLDVHVLDHVGPDGVHGGDLGEEASLAAVGAAVQHEAASARHERPVLAGAGLELDHHPFATVVGRDELLLAREHELDGPPRGAGERRDVPFVVEIALRAEAAAEERNDDAHVRLRNLEDVSDAGPSGVGDLRQAPDGDAVALPLGRSARGSIGAPCEASVT